MEWQAVGSYVIPRKIGMKSKEIVCRSFFFRQMVCRLYTMSASGIVALTRLHNIVICIITFKPMLITSNQWDLGSPVTSFKWSEWQESRRRETKWENHSTGSCSLVNSANNIHDYSWLYTTPKNPNKQNCLQATHTWAQKVQQFTLRQYRRWAFLWGQAIRPWNSHRCWVIRAYHA